MPRLTYILDDGEHVIDAPEGAEILFAAEEAGVDPPCGCHQGHCGACAVEVLEGRDHLAVPQSMEEFTLNRLHAPPNVRLACCAQLHGPVKVKPWDPFANQTWAGVGTNEQ